MDVSLHDILALAGRLDDAPGFDTPRERFRRFLVTRAAAGAAAPDSAPASLPAFAALIEQGQYIVDEQHRRAVQDAVVVLGRFLGFETSFGSYERVAGVLKFDGLWRSPQRVEMTLDVRTGDVPRAPADLDDLARALAALPSASRSGPQTRRYGLCIVPAAHGDSHGLDTAVAAHDRLADIRIVSIRSLLWLAGAAGAGRLRHDDVVRLLTAPGSVDFVIDLMARMAATDAAPRVDAADAAESPELPSAELTQPAAPPAAPVSTGLRAVDPRYWLFTVEPDDGTTAEQFVASVIGARRLLGIRNGHTQRPRFGDWVCFSVPGRGIVGHAQIESMADAPPPLREAHRYGAVFTLKNVDLYELPLALGPGMRNGETAWREADEAGAPLMQLAGDEFGAFTARATPVAPDSHRDSANSDVERQSA